MEKTTLGLLAALGALAATPAGASVNAASTQNILKPASLAELLDPVPNAVEVMKALRAEESETVAPVELADTQISIGIPGVSVRHHHHHHHHHRIFVHHHHHHHHHNNNY